MTPTSAMTVHTRPQVGHLGGTRFGIATETVSFSPSNRDVHRFTFDANAGRVPYYAAACLALPIPITRIDVNGTPIQFAPPVTVGTTLSLAIITGGFNPWLMVGPLLPVPVPMCPTCVWLVDPWTAQWTDGFMATLTIPMDPNLIGTTVAFQALQSEIPGLTASCPFPFTQAVTPAGVIPIN